MWQARDGLLDRDVALKVVNNAEHARLSHEARTAARVNHPNVVAVYDAGQDQGTVFVVMELVEGVDLGQVLRANCPFDAATALDVHALDLVAALEDLDERARLLLYRRFWEGVSQREVGEELGVSQAHVSRLEQGALEQLKGLLGT